MRHHACWRTAAALLCAAGLFLVASCSSSNDDTDTAANSSAASKPVVTPASHIQRPSMDDTAPSELPGLHNVVAYQDDFYSGGVPYGEEAFIALRDMGVKTIISVDGAVPEVALAQKYGMTYIHLPIGYNGFSDERRLELARATRDAMAEGPVYTHCHHGKHRSAGAAGAIAVSLGWATPDQMIERMKVSGTSPQYTGLYACTANSTVIEPAILESVPADFPSVSRPEGMVKAMVDIDIVTEHLKAIEKAGWQTPEDHPDLVPAAEAGRMADLFRLTEDDERVRAKPADFLKMWRENGAEAQLLEDMIVADAPREQLSEQLQIIIATCNDCHDGYRNTPESGGASLWNPPPGLLSFLCEQP